MLPRRISASCSWAACAASLALASAPAAARAQAHPFTLEQAFTLRNASQVALSPDGRSVVYVVEEKDLARNITFSNLWVKPADGGAARPLTFGTHTNAEPAWSPDGRQLAFVSDRAGTASVWVIAVDGGEARPLETGKEPVSHLAWSPDGATIAYLAAESPNEDAERAQRQHRDDQIVTDSLRRPVRLWTVAANGSSPARRLTDGARQVNELAWAPDSRRIAIMTSPASGEFEGMTDTHITLISRDGTGARDLTIDKAWAFNSLSWSPDGRTVAFGTTYPALKLAEARITLYDVASGARKAIPPDFDGGESGYAWAGGGTIVFSAQVGTVGRLFRYDLAADRVAPLGAAGDQLYRALSVDHGGSRVAFVARDSYDPGNVYVSSLGAFAPQKLTDLNPELAQTQLGKTETVTWKGADGWTIDGVLVRPTGYQAGQRYPTIVVVHGGPSGVNAQAFDPFAQMLAGRGYAVFSPNPRGGQGHGDKFYAGNYRDFGGKDYQDIMTGVDHVIEMGVADPERLGVWGWSYGGYMTYWIVTHTSRFKAAMSGAGLSDLGPFYAQSDIQSVWNPSYFGVSPYKDPELYRRMSPMTYIDHATTPTLILYGANDIRVPYAEGREFYVALREKGVPTQLVLYPREGHGFREPDHERDRWQRSMNWFDRYVLGRVAAR